MQSFSQENLAMLFVILAFKRDKWTKGQMEEDLREKQIFLFLNVFKKICPIPVYTLIYRI